MSGTKKHFPSQITSYIWYLC